MTENITKLNKASVFHQSSYCYCYAACDDSLYIRLTTAHGNASSVVLFYKNLYDHTGNIMRAPLPLLLSDGITDMYEVKVSLSSKRFKYYFEITDNGGDKYNYCSDGFSKNVTEGEMFFYPYVNSDEIFNFPKWAMGASIYQVLLDRFHDGDSSNNPPDCKPREYLPDSNTYYGGDFKGLAQKLDYLTEMGVDVIYLSPLFKSPSYHKYDVTDYYAIDEIYGTKQDLISLVEQAHNKGIRIILDCVFNHCSSQNSIFLDVKNEGENSRYKDWFCLNGFPVDDKNCNYDSFGGIVPSMPRFNTTNDEVIDYLTGVAEYWTKALNIDGWRLDVADEVSHLLWQKFRKRLLKVKPDLLIIGEIWNQATQWLDGTEMHTVTNYKFRKCLLELAEQKIAVEEFWNRYNHTIMLYKTPAAQNLVNLVGSHDTIRLTTKLKSESVALCVLITMLTFTGMPLTYYGDELAMQGDDDPDNRRAMDWSKIQSDFARQYREVAKLRHNSDVLRYGTMSIVNAGEHILAFTRNYLGKTMLVAINFGDKDGFNYGKKHFETDTYGYFITEV